MIVKEIVKALGLEVISEGKGMETEVVGGYASDLLSDVMGNIDEAMVWLTVQVHRNTIAVAALKEVAAVVLVSGAKLDEEVAAEAKNQGVTVLATAMPAFEAAGRIWEMLK